MERPSPATTCSNEGGSGHHVTTYTPVTYDKIKSIRLTLVRHGQTVNNRMRVVQGQSDSDLTDMGKEQAMLLGKYFLRKKVKFDKVYSSDLMRAYGTCRVICDNCQKSDQPEYTIHQTAALRERSYGVLQGLKSVQLKQKALEAGHDPLDMGSFRPEGGETLADVMKRVTDFCYNELFLKSKHLQRILIVSHGGPIREFMRLFAQHNCPLNPQDIVCTPNSALNNFDIHLSNENVIAYIYPRRIHKLPHLTFNVFDRTNPSGEDSEDDEEIDLLKIRIYFGL